MKVEELRKAIGDIPALHDTRAMDDWWENGVIRYPAAKALLEYASLLEASERVWWCARITQPAGFAKCSPDLVLGNHEACGWRLLTPTESTS